MKEFGIESLSSSQVSRATKLLDDELEAWRNRSLGEVRHLIVDARYEKFRFGGVVRDVAVLSAIGIGSDERRRVLGVSGSRCQKQRSTGGPFSLQDRGMRGVRFVVSDDHAGLQAARKAVLSGAIWHKMPSITPPTWRFANASALNCAISGMPLISTAQMRTCVGWSKVIATRHQTWPPGLKIMSPMDWPSLLFPNTTGGACALQIRSSAASSRNSKDAPEKSASSQIQDHSNVWSATP